MHKYIANKIKYIVLTLCASNDAAYKDDVIFLYLYFR